MIQFKHPNLDDVKLNLDDLVETYDIYHDCEPIGSITTTQTDSDLYINYIYLDHEYRQHRLLTDILQKVSDLSQKNGVHKIQLEPDAPTNKEIDRLLKETYSPLGFKQTGKGQLLEKIF